MFQSSHESTSTERDKVHSVDRQCGLASLENIKEQEDEIDNKLIDDFADHKISESDRENNLDSNLNSGDHTPAEDHLFEVENEGNATFVQKTLVQQPAFTERSSQITKAPFDEELNALDTRLKGESIPLSPKEGTFGSKHPSKKKMNEK